MKSFRSLSSASLMLGTFVVLPFLLSSACKQPPPPSGASAGSGGGPASGESGQGGSGTSGDTGASGVGGSVASAGSSQGGSGTSGEAGASEVGSSGGASGAGGSEAMAGSTSQGGMAGMDGVAGMAVGGEGGSEGGGAAGSKPDSCPDNQWLCHGSCVPMGTCQARELRFGKRIFSYQNPQLPKEVRTYEFFLNDFNGDGLQDVVYATQENQPHGKFRHGIYVALSLGNCKFDMEHQIVLVEDPPGNGNGFVLWMRDMNGDSSPDLVASRIPIQHPELGSSEVVLVYLKAGEAPKVETITAGMIGLNKFLGPINVGDVDGDGGQDLLIVPGGLPVEGPVAFLRRSVDGKILSITDSWPKGSTGFGWQSSQSEVLDLDGDGRAELFHYPYLSDMGQAPSVQVPFESISWDGSSWNPTKLTFSPKSKGTFLDLNEDGVTDFVNPGEMWFNKNKGFYEKKDFEGSAAPRDGTIDLDLDGNIDLPAGGWYRGNGFGHFENGSPILYEETQASVGSARFADFSGDGVYDIVNQGGGGTISCHINIGKPILK